MQKQITDGCVYLGSSPSPSILATTGGGGGGGGGGNGGGSGGSGGGGQYEPFIYLYTLQADYIIMIHY